MSKLRNSLAMTASALLGAACLFVPFAASATDTTRKVYSYAAKFLCEVADTQELETKVNIHNPSLTRTATVFIKVATEDGEIDGPFWTTLSPDYATSFECANSSIEGEIEGFLVVLSLRPLDVIGVTEIESDEVTSVLEITAALEKTQTIPTSDWNSFVSSAEPFVVP